MTAWSCRRRQRRERARRIDDVGAARRERVAATVLGQAGRCIRVQQPAVDGATGKLERAVQRAAHAVREASPRRVATKAVVASAGVACFPYEAVVVELDIE